MSMMRSTVYLSKWNYPLGRKEMHLSNVDAVRNLLRPEVTQILQNQALLLTLLARSKRSRSTSSSGLSETPKAKHRRVKSSPLSDDDVDGEDGDQDEDQDVEMQPPTTTNLKTPATPTIFKGQKVPPVPVMSGARPNARAGKKRATGTSASTANKTPNGIQSSHAPKIKQEEDMDDRESVSETVTTATVAEETAAMSIDVSHADNGS
jgi:hypothetical protein